MFVSRKEGKLFVRKGFDPVFDTPVTFEQSDQPLGTHVFTALSLKEDNTNLNWMVVYGPDKHGCTGEGDGESEERHKACTGRGIRAQARDCGGSAPSGQHLARGDGPHR